MAAKPEGAKKSRAERRIPWRGWASVVLAVVFAGLYWLRPLATEAVTIWPSWIWAVFGLVFVLDRPRRLWKSVRWPLVAWLFVALAFSEVWRVVMPPSLADHDLRVVTVNTGGNMLGAMREAASLSPDLVLLQESADVRNEPETVREHFGPGYEGVFGMDASILVRGKVLASYAKQSNFTIAHVRLDDGREVDVVSLRLNAPHVRLDYWSRDCWEAYARHRTEHLEELRELWRRVNNHRSGAPLVFGGDFNLVPDAGEIEILGGELTDTFRAAGRGWYATALDGAPLFRIDKVWCSKEFVPKDTHSQASHASDHRLVVAQMDWK